MKRIALLLVVAVLVLGGVLVGRALVLGPEVGPVPEFEAISFDESAAVTRLAEAVKYRTLSHADRLKMDAPVFEQFHNYLALSFPGVHGALQRETVNELSLLYTWQGTDPEADPVILLAHQDVVPVEAGTESDWTHPAFDGVVDDEHVWGRGSLDDKGSLMGILEAAEALVASGFEPRRTVYFCFGHDEEVGGEEGAAKIAELLVERGVDAYLLLDEGLAITRGIVPGIATDLALVGLAEKGYLTVTLRAETEGGHSSTPPEATSVGIVAAAVARLQEEPFPAELAGPMRQMLQAAGPEMAFPMRLVMANLWLFAPIVRAQLAADPSTNAAIRTTTAPTMFNAGTKENVLPQAAEATVNFRLMPGDTVESAVARIEQVIGDPRVTVAVAPHSNDPSPVSRAEGEAWQAVETSIRQVFDDTAVAPGLVLGGTDCPHYEGVARDIYRFLPFVFTGEDMARVHGTDERVRIADYLDGIRFYAQFLRNAAG